MIWLLIACRVQTPATGVPDRTLPVEDSGDTGLVPVGGVVPPAVWINEVMTQNDSTWQAADGSLPGWAEIKNGSSEAVDRADLSWKGAPITWADAGITLGPGELALATLSDSGSLTLDWQGLPIDALDPGKPGSDVAWARFADASGASVFELTGQPTPGYENGTRPPVGSPADLFFADYSRFDLTIPQDSWNSLEADPYTPVPATLGYERVWLPVTVHLKGVYGSLRTIDGKASFSIDMNGVTSGGSMRGLKKLKLNNMVQDPSGVHENLTYSVFRAAGVAAPRAGYAQVYVNGEYYGVYANIEAEDSVFLEHYFGNTGNLYEGAYGVDFIDGEETSFQCDECLNPDDRSDITAVTAVLDQAPTDANLVALNTVVDLDEWLTELAVEQVTLHWDGYTTANNYRIFHDPADGRFKIIPWGVDQTWIDEYYDPWGGYGRVLTFCIANPTCLADYNAKLLAVADLTESLQLATVMTGLLETYNADFLADPRVEWLPAEHQQYVELTLNDVKQGPQRVRDEVAARP